MKLNTCICGSDNVKLRRDIDDSMGLSIGFFVFCDDCKISTPYSKSADDAISEWNKK